MRRASYRLQACIVRADNGKFEASDHLAIDRALPLYSIGAPLLPVMSLI